MKNLKDLTYGIVGLGIMGGACGKAVRQNILSQSGSRGKMLVCNRSTACLSMAVNEGIADEAFTQDKTSELLKKSDIVFVCLYPHATLEFLKNYKNDFKSGAIVTDISGVKGIFEKSLPELLRPDVDFIIGHPMAGGEKEGYAASNAKFFVNHNYIFCRQTFNSEENYNLMKTLVTELGFTRITETTCDIHDNKIGFTSQLCHVIASALVQSARDPEITAFGGGSFEDLTRIAMINAPLWTELFISNKEKLCAHIDSFQKKMEEFRTAIMEEDSQKLKEMLEETREKRLMMGSVCTVAR